jgi:hypothetical protein
VDLLGVSYNLMTDEKWDMSLWLRGVKVPTCFCSNIKLTSFTAHDCHVMLIIFLPIVIKAIDPEYMKTIITHLGYFLNFITQKVINEVELPTLKHFIVDTIC